MAAEAYEASRKADEMVVAATRRIAFCYVRSGAPRTAIPLFEASLGFTPLRPELYGGLAVAHLNAGMAQRAAAQSARAIQAGVDPALARKAVAKAFAETRAYDRAAPELEACVSYDVNDADAWRELALACRWLGRFKREEECLRRLQLLDPDSLDLRYEMARCERDQGRAPEALEMLEPLLEEAQVSSAVLLLAAEVVGSCGNPQLQREFAQLALEHGDSSGWGHFWLADSYAELTPEAREAYRAAVESFQAALADGATTRRAAKLWQGIYLATEAMGEAEQAEVAARHARQQVSVCEALGAEIESVAHRRAVPSAVFLESFPAEANGGDKPELTIGRGEPRATAQAEMPLLRQRLPRGAQGRNP
jgi:tetratricopeptide (TPR) repeat protein